MRLGRKSHETTFATTLDAEAQRAVMKEIERRRRERERTAQWDAEIAAIHAEYEREERHERALKAQARALRRLESPQPARVKRLCGGCGRQMGPYRRVVMSV